MKIKVSLPVEYPRLWERLTSSIPLNKKWSSESFRNYLKARYNLDVEAYPADWVGTIYVDDCDWTMFLLRLKNEDQNR